MFQKDPYSTDHAGRIGNSVKPMNYGPQQPYHPDQQPYRDYDHPPSRYDVSSGGGGYTEPKYRSKDHIPLYENSVPHYDQQQWNPYGQSHSAASPPAYDVRLPYSDGPDAQYTPPLRYDEPPPQQGFDGRPRYGKPVGQGPVYHDDLPPAPQGSDQRYDQDPRLSAYPSAARSPEPAAQRPPYNQGPPSQPKGYKPQQYDPAPVNFETSRTPPKAETPSPSPADPPKSAPVREDRHEEDPAMRPQSVLTRVKMFENKRSVSVDRVRDGGDPSGNKVNVFLPNYHMSNK